MANPRGEKHHASKLTEDDVRMLRRLYAEGQEHRKKANALSINALAKKFEVHPQTMFEMLSRRTWIHVD